MAWDERNAMNDTLDRSKLPESMRGLNWEPMTDDVAFYDGDHILAVVQVHSSIRHAEGEWEYQIDDLLMHVYDDDDCSLEALDDSDWGWMQDDISWFVRK
jgi:hypothetical protein